LGQGSYDAGIVLQKLWSVGFTGPIDLQCFHLNSDPKILLTVSMEAWR